MKVYSTQCSSKNSSIRKNNALFVSTYLYKILKILVEYIQQNHFSEIRGLCLMKYDFKIFYLCLEAFHQVIWSSINLTFLSTSIVALFFHFYIPMYQRSKQEEEAIEILCNCSVRHRRPFSRYTNRIYSNAKSLSKKE